MAKINLWLNGSVSLFTFEPFLIAWRELTAPDCPLAAATFAMFEKTRQFLYPNLYPDVNF